MSHVATIDLVIQDLKCLEAACRKLGLELVRDQKTYRWWGEHVGDYPIPDGFTVDDLGTSHAIRVAGFTDEQRAKKAAPYEIGVVRRRDGKPGWQLLWDFIDTRLVQQIGTEGRKLKVEYAHAIVQQHALRNGYRVHEQQFADGSRKLLLQK